MAAVAGAQEQLPFPEHPHENEPPNMTAAMEAILKAEREKNLKDLEAMARLVEEVRAVTRKNEYYVISLESIRKLEQIEKLSRVVRNRMKR